MATQIVKQRLSKTGVNLVDFTVFSIPEKLRTSRKDLLSTYDGQRECFTQESIELMGRALYGSKGGVGDIPGVPQGLMANPHDASYDSALEEWELVAFDVVAGLLDKIGLKPTDASPEKRALVVLNENLTSGFYGGNHKPFLIANLLFRLGGAAVLLSNRKADKKISKYSLRHVIRSINTDDEALECIKHLSRHKFNCPMLPITGAETRVVLLQMASDPQVPEKTGVQINGRKIVDCASVVLKDVLMRLAPLVLPVSELVKVAKNPKHKVNFSTGFQHVVIHPGAVKVIDGVRSVLGFGDKAAIPSLQTLNRFGNTSSSSIFYILANVESRIGVKKGDNVLQLAMGSGFKAAAATWKARRYINEEHPAWQGDPCLFIPIEDDPYAQKYQQASSAIDIADMDIPSRTK